MDVILHISNYSGETSWTGERCYVGTLCFKIQDLQMQMPVECEALEMRCRKNVRGIGYTQQLKTLVWDQSPWKTTVYRKKPRSEPWERLTLYKSGQEAHSSQVMHMSSSRPRTDPDFE